MTAEAETRRLLEILVALRDPKAGCPWDRIQDFDSIAPYTIEEAYEVADAIERRDYAALPEELGDLLLQVVYHARIAEEAGLFSYADVVRRIADKMISRHPHVFAGSPAGPESWEDAKQAERQQRSQTGALAGVPRNLPALARAAKLSARAARVGFDWSEAAQAIDKLEEETRELREEVLAADAARLSDEIGDVLFAAANVARKLGLDPETCLRQAGDKFTRRFGAMEAQAERSGRSLGEYSLKQQEALWRDVKCREREGVLGTTAQDSDSLMLEAVQKQGKGALPL